MTFKNNILNSAARTIGLEAKSIYNLLNYLDNNFVQAVERIHESNGTVIITGIGKSAAIANKIVSSMNSTGTPAIFMHSGDAIHGDIGVVKPKDIVICISKSGNSPEIKSLLPAIKKLKNLLIAITGDTESDLAKMSDLVISSYVEKEACPNNLAPTSSTSAQLAIGDALTICLLELNNFNSNDFAKYHPGGSLGKKLTLNVGVMARKNPKPQVNSNTSFKELLHEISKNRLGATIVQEKSIIIGIITDGDIRRVLEKNNNLDKIIAEDIMSKNPLILNENKLAYDALVIMESKGVSQIIIKNDKEKYIGIVHILDIIKEGIK